MKTIECNPDETLRKAKQALAYEGELVEFRLRYVLRECISVIKELKEALDADSERTET